MKDGGRLAAAIEVLMEIESRHRPAQLVLRDWGLSHRFAGSGDRTIIGNLVFDALRHKMSLSHRIGRGDARSLVLATYAVTWGHGLEVLKTVLDEDRHAPAQLTAEEEKAFQGKLDETAPVHMAADVPDWLWPLFERSFADLALEEGRALSARAPIDLRVNTLKANRDRIERKLSHVQAQSTSITPTALRIRPKQGAARMPHVQAEEGYQKGWFELQDEASQVAALLAQARPGEQVLDLCAGGGGKTLALAAAMQNRGQIYAYDADRLRLAPIYERVKRAGVRNVQVRDPVNTGLGDLEGMMDLVFIDAPCTGTGVWRRRPDSKWKLSEKALKDRLQEQHHVLENAARYVRPGGRILYATCSVLPVENQDQVTAFLKTHTDFEAESALDVWKTLFEDAILPTYVMTRGDVLLTPASTSTDGFFLSIMRRRK